MRNHHQHGKYWDLEAVAQHNILHLLPLQDSAEEGMGQATARLYLETHLELLQTGIVRARDHQFVERKIQEADPNLRLRWDYKQGLFAIDRFAPQLGHHLTIFFWSHTLGEGLAIRAILLASDMQRADTPQAYHKLKQEMVNAALKRKESERAENALAAVDQLSTERIKNFLAVERALQIGEKIHVSGDDAKWLNRQYERTQAGLIPDVPTQAINPGMHPFKHRRMNRY